ncbi:MAG: guanylate kinase [Lachnospiraceae bacterium]|nr:guanylate kinase [Lachnospiraceae bacterium]
MAEKGILLVVSGFSGAGKGTLLQKLLEKYDSFVLSISATTRNPREGERDGREYFFRSKEEFEAMIEAGDLIEYACYVGNYYGTPRAYVEEQLAQGKDVILEIEIQGARKIKERYPDSVLLFLSPPSAEELKRRLISRGTESMEVVENRLSRAAQEAQGMEDYDYFVINDNLEDCVRQVHQIIESEHARCFRNGEQIRKIREEVEKFQK